MTLKSLASRRVRARTEHPALRLKKILVPVDFSPASKKAFKYALRFAEEFAAELTLLYVLGPVLTPGPAGIERELAVSKADVSDAEKNLRALTASARNGRAGHPQRTMRTGVPAHEIVEVAKEADIDLIVLATHGHTGWKHFCIGSTAERVVRAAPCPVLVVREKEYEFS